MPFNHSQAYDYINNYDDDDVTAAKPNQIEKERETKKIM